MKMQEFFTAYIGMKYLCHKSNLVVNKHFEYCWYDDDSAELFLKKTDETMLGWDRNCLSPDPHYDNKLDNKKPLLHNKFKQLNLYDELVFHYMIFTLNSVTVIHNTDKYNVINDFMKNYSFFQLTRLSNIRQLSIGEAKKLKSLLFHFLLYCHPVNEETLKSFAIINNEITHLPTNIKLKDYSSAYYDYYMNNYHKYQSLIVITPSEINAIKSLNHLLIDIIETGHPGVNIPPVAHPELNIDFINNIDAFIKLYAQREIFFNTIKVLLDSHKIDKYHNYYLSMFLQNYVLYILRNNFYEIEYLFSFFSRIDPTQTYTSLIINKIYGDAIFIKHFMNEQKIKFSDIKFITTLFNSTTKEMYGVF